ncbi:MAG TPA: SWIM zinc finger family protein [Rudaea sp.]|nr:SWIM zinc finger family protein [Rudaea sp.]
MPRFEDRFPRWSKPLPVRGGIQAQSKHGPFGERWWGKRWIAVLESFGLGARLARGRSYARRGQVTEIAVEPSGVRATVQGSREDPYVVTLRMTPLTHDQWGVVTERILHTPRFLAMLLNGDMPDDIEIAFRAAGCDLFPNSVRDVHTTCSCPDASNPCKHVAAVYYLVGEEFDRDPFLLFALRGLTRDALLAALSLEASGTSGAAVPAVTTATEPAAARPPLDPPPLDAWPLRRAGRFPFWSGERSLEEALSAVYREAAERAAAFLAETWPDADR